MSNHQTGAAQLQSWFLDLDRILERIERAASHYQLFDLEHSASREEIFGAYQRTLERLFPAYQISQTFPPELRQRLDQSFSQASTAFSILADCQRRREYDALFGSRNPARAASEGAIEVRQTFAQREVCALSETEDQDRRRCGRFRVKLPVRVTGHELESGKWQEMAETIDVSRTGVILQLNRRVRHNRILHLSLPLPVKLRAHGFADPTYSVYAVVRRIIPLRKGARAVGLEFIGENPPNGYLEKPWAACRTKQWQSANRRRQPRLERTEPVLIEFLNEERQLIAKDQAMTESAGRGGARIRLTVTPPAFDLIRVTFSNHNFTSLAIVVNQYLGRDGAFRAHLWFVEDDWLN
jgi:hypothetical protein